MAPFVRKVKTASGATAVQLVDKTGGRYRILEHLGSAHSEVELLALVRAGRDRLNPGQQSFDFEAEDGPAPGQAVVKAQASMLLTDAIRAAYDRLGLDVIDDEAFYQLVLARLVEPTSKADSVRVLTELGVPAAHRNTFVRALQRCARHDYRDLIAKACFAHCAATSGLSLVLYDVTTLYFEAENEDDYRKVGYSKERRVDPQIVVGLLVDRAGFPLEIHAFEGSKAETHTIVPVIKAFQDRHGVADMVVVADAGMLSATNLQAIDDAGLRFIVGSRVTKAPADLAKHFHWNGTHHQDGTTVDTITMRATAPVKERITTRAEPVWDPERDLKQWRAVWQYRRKRALRDQHTLTAQRNRAIAIIDGETKPKKARFITEKAGTRSLDEAAYQRAMDLVGWKGYVTNIPATIMPAVEVIGSYHDLWHVEQSFRMSKTDLRARPIFHRKRDAVEAHLTVVFAALAVARHLQATTGHSVKRIVQALKPLRTVTISLNGHDLTAAPQVPAEAAEILKSLKAAG